MDPITITTAAAKIVSTTLQVVQTCNEYYQKYKAVDLQLVCMQTQCSIIEVALLQIQDVIVHDLARFDRLRSVSVLASNYERTLGACQIVFAILKERLNKLNNHLHDNCGKPDWQLKLKVIWNDQESAMLLKNIEGQASAISLLLNAIQMKTQIEMFGLLSRKESKSVLKTASDDADTLSLAHESNISIGLPDGESVATSKLDDREFDFDFEIINTAAYRKVFNMARSKIPPNNGSRAYSPPQASTSSGVSAPETVGLRSKLPQKNGSGVYSPPQAFTSSGVSAPEPVRLRRKPLQKNSSGVYSPPQASTSSGVSAPEPVRLRSKPPQKNSSGVYSPPQASTSGDANAPETVGLHPTSFNTNVNRAKTKKWLDAKSYSYDGDDWGDVDDYDEYGGYNEPDPVPRLSINAHAAIHPVVASKESEPFSSRPNASSRSGRIILLADGTEVLTESDETEMFDHEEEDKDLEPRYQLSINAHAAIHPVVASKESEPFSSRPNASSRSGRIILLADGTEVLTESDETEMFDHEEEDKDLEPRYQLSFCASKGLR